MRAHQPLGQDRPRAARLLQRLINPARGGSTTALNELAREDLDWEQRWTRAEAAVDKPAK